MTRIISVRQQRDYVWAAIRYFQKHWASSDGSKMVYQDAIKHSLTAESPLPQWYLLQDGDTTIGCAGLITNDFISRMDLWPWFCALYIEPDYRGKNLGSLLMQQAAADAAAAGFDKLYLCTDHVGYYEKMGFICIGTGYHPWGETSRIFQRNLKKGGLLQ